TQITVGNAIPPITIDAKMRPAFPELPKINKIITANKTGKIIGKVFVKLTKHPFPLAFDLLVYIVITVHAAGKAIIVKITAITASIIYKEPVLKNVPSPTNAVIKISEIALHLMEPPKLSCLSATVSHSL